MKDQGQRKTKQNIYWKTVHNTHHIHLFHFSFNRGDEGDYQFEA